ncbi:MAG: hypothetical protein ABL911_03160 [Gallionella sp.]
MDKVEVKFSDRLWGFILAPIVFNVSNMIVLSIFFRRSYWFAKYWVYDVRWFTWFVLLCLIIIPAVAGFILGTSKLATLLGHFFYTNMEHEKDVLKTSAAWIGLFGISYFISQVV